MKIIIIGGEAAGMSAAAKARRVDRDAEIIVYEASTIISFGACGLPYYVGDEFDDAQRMTEFTPEDFAKRGITVKTQHRVVALDATNKTVTVEDGQGQRFTDPYDRLMIATGASAATPPWPGRDLAGVHKLRVLDDGVRLKAAIKDATRAVVVGSGFIGLEIAEALVHQGLQVTLIERASRVIGEAFDAEIGEVIAAELAAHGVKLVTGEAVEAFEGTPGATSRVGAVITQRDRYATDLVVSAVGVRPNTDFLRASGISLLENGAIITDEYGRTSLPDVYAAGDCASVVHRLTGKPFYSPLATVANKLGRMIGENIASESGALSEFPGMLGSAAVRVFGVEAGRVGLSVDEAIAAGFATQSVVIDDQCHTSYVAGQSPLRIKLVYESGSCRLLGGQIVGRKGAVHRVDALAVAISAGLSTRDLGWIDFAYAPPFSRTWDALNVAGNVAKS
ncbi:CoA-disulfide reductase [Chitinolyticbacter albus]|uniref:CoA-disulfide reductase n=1 Tax=Chitinolyticbacter albus TaxID=2961951 RepID=UPI00210A5BAF|nr:CoA-disulfide reductase [Chitinolyticbacter albus]